jgi:GNAT superfamily N-acetyltransferase
MQARRAGAADLDAVIETLVDSHLGYIWEVWALSGSAGDRRARLTELVRRHVELIAFPHREIWIAADGAAVAIWSEQPEPPVARATRERMDDASNAAYGARRALIAEVDVILQARRPDGPHRFLGSMGVSTARQREGLGSAVLRPVLEELDRDEIPACLETSTVGNVAFYGRLGFTVHAHLNDLPGGAPETWVMWRAPAAAT